MGLFWDPDTAPMYQPVKKDIRIMPPELVKVGLVVNLVEQFVKLDEKRECAVKLPWAIADCLKFCPDYLNMELKIPEHLNMDIFKEAMDVGKFPEYTDDTVWKVWTYPVESFLKKMEEKWSDVTNIPISKLYELIEWHGAEIVKD